MRIVVFGKIYEPSRIYNVARTGCIQPRANSIGNIPEFLEKRCGPNIYFVEGDQIPIECIYFMYLFQGEPSFYC